MQQFLNCLNYWFKVKAKNISIQRAQTSGILELSQSSGNPYFKIIKQQQYSPELYWKAMYRSDLFFCSVFFPVFSLCLVECWLSWCNNQFGLSLLDALCYQSFTMPLCSIWFKYYSRVLNTQSVHYYDPLCTRFKK